MDNRVDKFAKRVAGFLVIASTVISLAVAGLVVWGLIELILWIGRH